MFELRRFERNIRKGFTMVEVMAVLIILGILATVVATKVVGHVDKSKVTATKASLKALHSAVISFKLDTGHFPSEEAGLAELVEEPMDLDGWAPGGYLETTEIPLDGWGNEFEYIRYPESGKEFVIVSYGADGQEGGEDLDRDLYSTDAR